MFYKPNRARCLDCGDVIESENINEWVECSCGSLRIRGGSSFLEREGKDGHYKELSVIKFPENLNFREDTTSDPPPPLPPGVTLQ